MSIRYPASELDKPDTLFDTLGSAWSLYGGRALVEALVRGLLDLEAQAHNDIRELVDARSIRTCPVWHTVRWYGLTLYNSRRTRPPALSFEHDSSVLWGAGNGYAFGQMAAAGNVWNLPEGVAAIPLLCNRTQAPSRTLLHGTDYVIYNGQIAFLRDPFVDELIPKLEHFSGSEVSDRSVTLWGYNTAVDTLRLHRLFSYVFGVDLPSSEQSRMLLEILLDALVNGTSAGHIRRALAAMAGVPLAQGDEAVELVETQADRHIVVTDKNAYVLPRSSTLLVSVGDALTKYQPLCDALVFYDEQNGALPPFERLAAVAVGRHMLLAGFTGGLLFENTDTAVETDVDDEGNLITRWAVRGWQQDVDRFFDELNRRCREEGLTLRDLVGAARINPAEFVLKNVFRSNTILAVVRPASFGQGCGLSAMPALTRLVPPNVLLLLAAQLEAVGTSITMNGSGDDLNAGYEETGATFAGNSFAEEALDPSEMTSERVRAFRLPATCG